MFRNRSDAGRQLAVLLEKYVDQPAIVYALPRGGVPVATEIARHLNAPLDLLLAHKIGHPYQPEYAIGAISESGYLIGNSEELRRVSAEWLKAEKERQLQEIARKRQLYLSDQPSPSVTGKIAIIVDDGIATGHTMEAGILEIKQRSPSRLVVAVPVAPRSTADWLETLVDEFVALEIPSEGAFLGAVGAYYTIFDQVSDSTVLMLLSEHRDFLSTLQGKQP
jgi:predicted phosphoribosyltransferase